MAHVIDLVAAKEIGERFPLGLRVKDRDGRTGVVVGYHDGKVVVEELLEEAGREPILRQTPIEPDYLAPDDRAPQHIAPVHPRPSRYELLAAVEGALLQAARLPTASMEGQETRARTVLALAQARAVLESGR